jgi:hypothetical protein
LYREDILDENEVRKLLSPITITHESKGPSSSEQLNAIGLLRFIEGRNDYQIDMNRSDGPKHDMNEDDYDFPKEVDYEFSNDPEIRALEKKIRNLGRSLSRKGLDVEGGMNSLMIACDLVFKLIIMNIVMKKVLISCDFSCLHDYCYTSF